MSTVDPQKFRGAMDLSALAKPASPATPDAGKAAEARRLTVPSLVVECTETNLREMLTISNSVPVIADFYSVKDAGSVALSEKLIGLANDLQGRVLLIRIDVEQNPKIATAFNVPEAATVVAIFRGQPVPLFSGDQTLEALNAYLDRVVEVAAENDLNGEVTSDGASQEQAPLPPRHQAAYDAITKGDYAVAISEYEQSLRDNPADATATRGLAQVRLLNRTQSMDFASLFASEPKTVQEVLEQADGYVAVGEFATGFKLLLDGFAKSAEITERDSLRKQLLELFLIVGNDDPAVAAARARLAGLLY
jgi:putative thioredoxin